MEQKRSIKQIIGRMIKPAGSIDYFPWMTLNESSWHMQNACRRHLAENVSFLSGKTTAMGLKCHIEPFACQVGNLPQTAQSDIFFDSVHFLSSQVRIATDSIDKVVRFRQLNRMGPRTIGLLHVQSSFNRWFHRHKFFCTHYSNACYACLTRFLR